MELHDLILLIFAKVLSSYCRNAYRVDDLSIDEPTFQKFMFTTHGETC